MARTFLAALLLLLASAFSRTSCWAEGVGKKKEPLLPALFSFGDSQLDAGNNVYVRNSTSNVNFPPYGETYFRKPTGRFTNGRTIADFIAMSLGLPLLHPSLEPGVDYTKGINFASGGSGLLDSTSFGNGMLPMGTQLHQFHRVTVALKKQLGASAAQKLLSESLYIVATGSNDLGINYMQNTTLQQSVKPQEFVATLVKEYKNTILALHNHSARKLAVFELGILGCTPFSRLVASLKNETGCLSVADQLTQLFNKGLAQLVDELRVQVPDLKIAFGKTFSIFRSIMDNSKLYGFASTTDACCGAGPFNAAIGCGRPVPAGYPYKPFTGKRPSKFLFWDDTHPTETAYSLVFKQLWSGNSTWIEPFSLFQLATMPAR